MKKVIAIFICLVLSIGIVMGLPLVMGEGYSNSQVKQGNEKSLIDQEVLSYSTNENLYYKLYESGKLIGVLNNKGTIDEIIESEYQKYEADFPNTKLGLKDDYYIVEEKSYVIFENIDDEIKQYLIDNQSLGVQASAVEFSTNEGIYDIIYVKDIEDFYDARNDFLLNFVSEETINSLRNNEEISEPIDFGTKETGIHILENMNHKDAIASPDDIMINKEEIYQYLCYGRNEERQYYTVKEGDTLSGVGYYFGDMSPKQLLMLNRNILSSEDQILTPGMQLNVTYYTSPITIEVTRKRLTQESITPDTPIYREDSSIAQGKTEIITEEVFGLKNVMYDEKWVNGVLQGSEVSYSHVVREPIQGIIALGTMPVFTTGTGNFIWPIDSPTITCHYGCYAGHIGTDLQSASNRWGPVYAADSGVVLRVSYDGLGGNWIIIDHNNGYWTYYGHLNSTAFPAVGDSVERGQVIGQIGMSGLATGPHCHFQMYVNQSIVNVCSIMNCGTIPNR